MPFMPRFAPKGNVLPEGATIKDLTNYGSRAGSGQPFGGQTLPLPKPRAPVRLSVTESRRVSWRTQRSEWADLRGSPPRSSGYRCPWRLGEAFGGEKSAGRGHQRLLRYRGQAAPTVPLMATSAACGFPSPADDYLDRPLDFNELLIENPAA